MPTVHVSEGGPPVAGASDYAGVCEVLVGHITSLADLVRVADAIDAHAARLRHLAALNEYASAPRPPGRSGSSGRPTGR